MIGTRSRKSVQALSALAIAVVCANAPPVVAEKQDGHGPPSLVIWARPVEPKLRLSHPSYATSIAWSPDGGRIAANDIANGVNLWDARSGKQIFRLHKTVFTGNSVAFSPSGDTLIVKSLTAGPHDTETSLNVIDAANAHVKTVVYGPIKNRRNSIDRFVVTSRGEFLLGAIDALPATQLVLFQTSDWAVKHVFTVNTGGGPLAASPTDDVIAIGTSFGAVVLCSVSRLNCDRTFTAFPSAITAIAFSPNGRSLAVGVNWAFSGGPYVPDSDAERHAAHIDAQQEAQNQRVRIFDVRSGEKIGLVRGDISVGAIGFHPDGGVLAVVDATGVIYLVNSANGAILQRFRAASAYARAVAFSPTGDRLAVGSHGQVTVYKP